MAESTQSSGNVMRKFDMKGKNIVITGANGGLGLSFAYALAQVGANIAGIDLHERPSNDFSSLSLGGKYKYYQADVADYEGLKDIINRIHHDFDRKIDGCIPAAGIIRDKPMLEHAEKDWRDTMDVNVNGVFFTVQHVALKMAEQKTGGSIVCIASTAGHKSLHPQTIIAYTASKYAVRGIAKQAAHELAQHNIRVNSVSPGTMLTAMLQGVMDQNPTRRKLFEDSCAMRRLATPDELSGIILYLLSDAASYTTGQDFLIDGGLV